MALNEAQRIELIQKMYVAYYGRPADTGGLDNWINHLVQHGDSAAAIMNAFGTSPEATALYGNPPNYAVAVDALYMQMFNRHAEPDGLQLYVDHLNAGRVTLADLALTIATGARNDDAIIFANKVEVATAFTEELATATDNILGYNGAEAAAYAADYLSGVTANDASVTAALANLSHTIATINGFIGLSTAERFDLTTGLDNMVGTNGEDVLIANLSSGPNGELANIELHDSFDALGGYDVLRLDAWNADVNLHTESDVSFTNFEKVILQNRDQNHQSDVTLDLAGMSGVDLEIRNFAGNQNHDVNVFNIDGDVLAVNFDGNDLLVAGVGGDVTLSSVVGDDIGVFDVGGNVTATDLNVYSLNIGAVGDVSVESASVDYLSIDAGGDVTVNDANDTNINITAGGDLTITNVAVSNDINANVEGDVVLSNVDNNDNININSNGNVTFTDVTADWIDVNAAGAVSFTNVDTTQSDYNINISAGGDVTFQNVDANYNIDIVSGGDVNLNDVVMHNSGTDININAAGDVDLTNIEADDNIGIIAGGDVTLLDVNTNYLYIQGDTISISNTYVDSNLNITFNDEITNGVVNLTDVTSGEWSFEADGTSVNAVVNIAGDVDVNGLAIGEHSDTVFANITFNTIAGSTLTTDYIEFTGETEATHMTITGAGAVDFGGLYDEDNLTMTYTGSGSLSLDDATWDPVTGSFVGSTATGSVNTYFDFTDTISFTYAGSKGVDTMQVYAGTINNFDGTTLSLNGGQGSQDNLILSSNTDLSAEAVARYSNFEVLTIADMHDQNANYTYNLINAGEFSSLVINDSNGNNNGYADVSFINLSNQLANNITIENYELDNNGNFNNNFNNNMFDDLEFSLVSSAQFSQNDVVSITVLNENTSQAVVDIFNTLTIDDVETINFDIIGFDANQNVNDAWTGFFHLDANDLRELTISGTVDFNIADINSPDLTVIDASGFVGSQLRLGGFGEVWTDEDITITGPNASDFNLDLNANGDVVLTSGSGDDDITIDNEDGNNNSYFVNLSVGDGNENIDVNSNGDVVITAGNGNKDINVDNNGDVTITTGNGVDDINIYNDGHTVITTADGNKDINVNSNGNVDIVTGAGNDDINIFYAWNLAINSGAGNDVVTVDYATDVTLTLGDGNDNFNYNYNDVYGDIVINAGSGNDDLNIHLDSDENLDSYTLTMGSGEDALYVMDSIYGTDDQDNNLYFEITDFNVNDDVIYMWDNNNNSSYVTVTNQVDAYTVVADFGSNEAGIIEFNFDADNNGVDLAGDNFGSSLLEAIGNEGSALIAVDDNQTGYIVAYNNGDAYLYSYQSGLDDFGGWYNWTSGDGENHEYGNLDIGGLAATANDGLGFLAGDTITLGNISGATQVTYTVSQNYQSAESIAAALATAVNSAYGNIWYTSFSGDTIYFESNYNGNPNDITYYVHQANLQANEIHLIGVLDSVTVGSLDASNIITYGND